MFVFEFFCFGKPISKTPNHHFYDLHRIFTYRYLETCRKDSNDNTNVSYQRRYYLFSCHQTSIPSILNRLTPALINTIDFCRLSFESWLSCFVLWRMCFEFWLLCFVFWLSCFGMCFVILKVVIYRLQKLLCNSYFSPFENKNVLSLLL